MDKYEYAVTKELEWLKDDEEVVRELIRRHDVDKKNTGWSRGYLIDRLGFIFDEQARLHMWMEEFDHDKSLKEERDEEE